MQSRWANSFPIIVALLAGALAYGLAAPSIGWMSLDDYALVYGAPLRPWPGVADAFLAGGEGRFSVHRLLCYPFIGYVGGSFGQAASHVFQVLLHLLCGWLVYAFLRRLRWAGTDAAWAVAAFLVVPWVSQPVYWWSAAPTIVSTIFILLAAHAYLTWVREGGRWLWACLASIFVAMLFYELWLGGFVLFFGLDVYLRLTEPGAAKDSWGRIAWRAFRRSWPVMIPYLLWTVAFLAFHRTETHQPAFSLLRAPVVFLSIHLRTMHWLTDTPWLQAFELGLGVLVSMAGGVLLAALVIALLGCLRQGRGSAPEHESPPSLGATLLLAWSVFLAGRLVFILQNGVATHTRHSYGAAIAAAIAFAAVLRWSLDRCPSGGARNAVRWCAGGALAVCVVVSAGIGVHYRETSAAEEATCSQLVPILPALPPDSTILVVGDPTGTLGETAYYAEGDGMWLGRRLRVHRPDVSAIVATGVEEEGDFLLIETAARKISRAEPWRVPRAHVSIFRWVEQRLIADQPGSKPGF